MKANEIFDKIRDMENNASRELNDLEREKVDIETSLSSYQTELQQIYAKFAKTQIMQNLEVLSPDVQALIQQTNELADQNRNELSLVDSDITEIEFNRNNALIALTGAKQVVMKALYSSPEYMQLDSESSQSQELLELTKLSSNQIVKEVTPKLDAYKANAIFNYLHSLGFGTEKYSSNLLTAKLDLQIARKYDYVEMVGNFDLLHQMKSAAIASIEAAATKYDTTRNRLHELVDEAQKTPEIIQAIKEFDKFDSELSIAFQDKQRLETEISNYLNFTDQGHNAAIQNVIHNLNVLSLEHLRSLAQATDSLDDDNALAEIEMLLSKVKSKTVTLYTCEMDIKKTKRTLSKVKSLGDILDDTQYSSSNYRYSNDSAIQSLLLGYVVGHTSSDSLLDGLKDECRYEPEENYSSYGRSNSSSDSFSSTDSISSDSFRTTDSF